MDKSISGCVSGIYDINGSRKPNKFGTKLVENNPVFTGDLHSFNGGGIENSCIGEIGDICVMSAAMGGDDATYDEMFQIIKSIDSSYIRPTYSGGNDNWQMAQDYCAKVVPGSHVPNKNELAKIAMALYGVAVGENALSTGFYYDTDAKQSWINNKSTIYTSLGIADNPNSFRLWASDGNDNFGAYYRNFDSNLTSLQYNGRLGTIRTVCLDTE